MEETGRIFSNTQFLFRARQVCSALVFTSFISGFFTILGAVVFWTYLDSKVMVSVDQWAQWKNLLSTSWGFETEKLQRPSVLEVQNEQFVQTQPTIKLERKQPVAKRVQTHRPIKIKPMRVKTLTHMAAPIRELQKQESTPSTTQVSNQSEPSELPPERSRAERSRAELPREAFSAIVEVVDWVPEWIPKPRFDLKTAFKKPKKENKLLKTTSSVAVPKRNFVFSLGSATEKKSENSPPLWRPILELTEVFNHEPVHEFVFLELKNKAQKNEGSLEKNDFGLSSVDERIISAPPTTEPAIKQVTEQRLVSQESFSSHEPMPTTVVAPPEPPVLPALGTGQLATSNVTGNVTGALSSALVGNQQPGPPTDSPMAIQKKSSQMSSRVGGYLSSKNAQDIKSLPQKTDTLNSTESSMVRPVELDTTRVASEPNSYPHVSEAFQWLLPVEGVDEEILSFEGAKETSADGGAWKILKRPESYLSTVVWSAGGKASARTLQPILSQNTLAMLNRLAQAEGQKIKQPGSGIVFGKLPKGAHVELSGSFDRPVILEDENQEEKSFAFLNAAPGVAMLYVMDANKHSKGSLVLPVLPDHAVFADLSFPKEMTLTGVLLDGASFQSKPKANQYLEVVGQNRTTKTKPNGTFVISNVVFYGEQPILIDLAADQMGGYRHRYKVKPSQAANLTLFQMSEKQLQTWMGQLEGGASPESGMVVAAFNELLKNQDQAPYEPGVISLIPEEANLKPETYVLSQGDHLMVHAPLQSEASRMIGFQLPTGINRAEVLDGSRKIVWSELLFSSPNVIQVLTPQ